VSHHLDADFLKKHKMSGAADGSGGACLNRHEGRKENNSCSHIWQAYLKAVSDPTVYNWKKYEALTTRYETGARVSKKRNIFPAGMTLTRKAPTPLEWDIGVGANFQDWRKPYWHNAHHIVPNAVLNASLEEAAQEDMRVTLLVRSGLLGALYNLNYQVNMIILPMGEQVARALGLPRHLIGAQKGGASEFRSHKNYSSNVKQKVDRVMTEYVKVFDPPKEKHPEEPSKLCRAKLEKCSSDVYTQIKAFGATSPGEALARMPAEMFK
jgi:hypothetical protein